MFFLIIKQTQVEAETPEEALAKVASGETINITIQKRPNPQKAAVAPAAKTQSPSKK